MRVFNFVFNGKKTKFINFNQTELLTSCIKISQIKKIEWGQILLPYHKYTFKKALLK